MQPIHSLSRHALLSLVVLAAVALAPFGARAGSSSDIVRESMRELDGGGGRVASFWWLPQEYWEQVAKELAIPAADQEKVRSVFRDYLLVGAFEFKLSTEKKPELATIAQIEKRATFYRNGEEVARGLVSYDARELERIKGQRTSRISEVLGYSNGDEIIHRDNLILL